MTLLNKCMPAACKCEVMFILLIVVLLISRPTIHIFRGSFEIGWPCSYRWCRCPIGLLKSIDRRLKDARRPEGGFIGNKEMRKRLLRQTGTLTEQDHGTIGLPRRGLTQKSHGCACLRMTQV